MPKCGKCNVELVSRDVIAKCVQCESTFHPQCTRVGSLENYKRKDSKKWKCDDCRDDSSSVRSNDDPIEERSIIEILNAMKEEINSNVKGVHDSVNQLSTEVRALAPRVETLEVGQTALEARCGQLEEDNRRLGDEVHNLQLQLQEAEQHSRCTNLEIVGLPVTSGEDIYCVLHKVAEVLNVSFKRDDISMAHRLRVFSKKLHAHPPIIVQFVSRTTREDWLVAARRKKGVDAKEIAASFPPGSVYINEQLTGANKVLLGKARRLAREKKLHFAGYFNGKVLVRVSENSKMIRVRSLNDLDKYDK